MQLALTDKTIITRREAQASGLKAYRTGKPCKVGHFAERMVAGRNCVECKASYSASYNKHNADAIRSQRMLYRSENKHRAAEKNRIYYQANKEKINSSRKGGSAASIHTKTYRKRNPEKVREIKRNYSARKRGAEGFHTEQDVSAIFVRQHGICNGCGDRLKISGPGKYHVDHIMALAKGGSNWPSNLQLLCPPCNMSKGAKNVTEWSARQ